MSPNTTDYIANKTKMNPTTRHPVIKRGSASKKMKWEPPKHRSNTKPKNHLNWSPPPNKTSLPKLSNDPTSSKDTAAAMYFPHYNGWDMPEVPLFFKHPSFALCWALSRFKRDGLSNIFGTNKYPPFMQYIGIAYTPESNVTSTAMPFNKKQSKIEKAYFSNVEFFLPVNSSLVQTKYIKCKDHLYRSCMESMKSLPDYQSSSNSIYKSNTRCPTSSHKDVEFCFSPFLASKKQPAGSFIKLESKFKYIKNNSYCDYGKNI